MELTLTINVISLDVSGTLSCGQGAKRNSTDEKPSQFQLRSVLPTALGPTSGGRGAQEPGRVAAVPDRELPAGGPGGLSGFSALSRGRSLGTSHALRCSRMSQRTEPSHAAPAPYRSGGGGGGGGRTLLLREPLPSLPVSRTLEALCPWKSPSQGSPPSPPASKPASPSQAPQRQQVTWKRKREGTRPQRWAHRTPREGPRSRLQHRCQTVTDTAPRVAARFPSPPSAVGKLCSGHREGPRKIPTHTRGPNRARGPAGVGPHTACHQIPCCRRGEWPLCLTTEPSA